MKTTIAYLMLAASLVTGLAQTPVPAPAEPQPKSSLTFEWDLSDVDKSIEGLATRITGWQENGDEVILATVTGTSATVILEPGKWAIQLRNVVGYKNPDGTMAMIQGVPTPPRPVIVPDTPTNVRVIWTINVKPE